MLMSYKEMERHFKELGYIKDCTNCEFFIFNCRSGFICTHSFYPVTVSESEGIAVRVCPDWSMNSSTFFQFYHDLEQSDFYHDDYEF